MPRFHRRSAAADVLAYLDAVHDLWFAALGQSARAGGDAPRDQLIAMFDAVDDE